MAAALEIRRQPNIDYGARLIGRDPMDSTVIWEELYAAMRDYGRTGFPVAALSAVDIALWDLKGKILGQPVAKLLGGQSSGWNVASMSTRDLGAVMHAAHALSIYDRRIFEPAAPEEADGEKGEAVTYRSTTPE